MTTLGLDEAGRGPVLGPMVLAGVSLGIRAASRLRQAGVCDSKSFGSGEAARARRHTLAQMVHAAADAVVVRVVDVGEIDLRVRRHELNHLEREKAIEIILASPPAQRIVADGETLFSPLRARFPHLVAKNHGEDAHISVAAASIVAKVLRDELFACIARRYQHQFGPLGGGGYDNAATRRFLRAYTQRHARLPPEARMSWKLSESPGP